MKILKNFHTHSSFCDGKNTPEEMIEAAIAKGFSTLGFSSHSMLPEVLEGVTLDGETIGRYVETIRGLAEKHKGKIEVLCGVEADYLKGVTDPDSSRYAKWNFDYIIGSIHFLAVDGNAKDRICIDHTPEILADGIRKYYGGSAKEFLKAYFAAEREMVLAYDFDIVGHPDLPRKFNSKFRIFDETEQWYVDELASTADAIAASGKIVEINTGAISRGWRDDPYPSEKFIALLKERKVPLILSSDAHAAEGIDCAFDRFANLATITDFRRAL
jgi:histidinol-phosphatase (PHP family)